MAIFTAVAQVPNLHRPVITIGSFDGVHLGHQKILQLLVQRAQELDGESLLLTFEPHPRKFLFPDQPLQLITPLQDKIPLLQRQQIDHVLVVHFDEHLANLSAEKYIEEILFRYIKPHTVIVGYDHQYGKNRSGNLQLLRQKGDELTFAVEELSAQMIDNAAVSSSRIRKALHSGDLSTVSQMLGRNYSFKGKVIHGQKLGRQIGYPTANLRLINPDQLIPAYGVYAVKVHVNGLVMLGMMNLGMRPTVSNDKSQHIEVNIFDFTEEIYGQLVEVELVQFIRAEIKFDNLENLKAQITKDEIAVRKVLQ